MKNLFACLKFKPKAVDKTIIGYYSGVQTNEFLIKTKNFGGII